MNIKYFFEVFVDDTNEFRWRFKAPNGQIIATGGEGYIRKVDCLHAIDMLQIFSSKAPVVYV